MDAIANAHLGSLRSRSMNKFDGIKTVCFLNSQEISLKGKDSNEFRAIFNFA